MRNQIIILAMVFCALNLPAQQKTYCNPINIDYGYCPIPNSSSKANTARLQIRSSLFPKTDKMYGSIMVYGKNEYYSTASMRPTPAISALRRLRTTESGRVQKS